jgi:hypothetical protein
MKKENLIGGILAIIAALMGIIGHMVLFMKWYQIGMHTPSAEPGCEILLKTIHPLMADLGMLGFLPIGDCPGIGLAWQLVYQCAIHGSRITASLLPAFLALPHPILLVPDCGGQGSLEPDPAGFINRHRLHLLLDERRSQHQPHHHHWGSDLHPCSTPALGGYARLGGGNGWDHHAATRMDARGRLGGRNRRVGGRHPADDRDCAGAGAFFAVCARADCLPDPPDHVRLARTVAEMDQCGRARACFAAGRRCCLTNLQISKQNHRWDATCGFLLAES